MRRVSLPVAFALTVGPLAAFAQTAGPSGGPASPTGTESPGPSTSAPSTAAPSATAGTNASATAGPPGAAALPAEPEPAAITPAPTPSARPAVVPTPAAPAETLERRQTQIIELHGYLRTRVELFNNFGLGWDVQPSMNGTPRAANPDSIYNNSGIPWVRNPEIFSTAGGTAPSGGGLIPAGQCSNTTQLTSNLRLRLDPEIHPTEFIGIYSQIDILDNLVLGSTPEGYYSSGRSTLAPLTAFSSTQITPTAGYNTLFNSIAVKRAWAEVTSQTLGQIRFGRQPSAWGLGIVANPGNSLDSDYQSTADRIQYAARIRPLALFAALAYDFASSGATSSDRIIDPTQGQNYDVSLYDDVRQVTLAVGRRLEPEQQRASLARGDVVINGGLYGVYRWQYLSGEGYKGTAENSATPPLDAAAGTGTSRLGAALVRRDAWALITDGWFQMLGRNFRIEVEAAYIHGQIYNIGLDPGTPMRAGNGSTWELSQFGAALETDYRLLNNRLTLHFNAGYASGDPDVEKLNYQGGLQTQGRADNFLTLFRFHPNYRVDLIFWRQIERQVSSAYYFRPGVQYNFIDEPNGDLFFGRVDAIWSRATDFVQTRGNHSDLGVELDATVQYQSNHRGIGSTDPRPAPGFYAFLQYGVFFPLAGLGPTDVERASGSLSSTSFNLQIAQTVRAFLGVAF